MRTIALVFLLGFACSGSQKPNPLPPTVNPNPECGERPTRPSVTFFDNNQGGVSLNREDSVDFLLYVADLEAWAACKDV